MSDEPEAAFRDDTAVGKFWGSVLLVVLVAGLVVAGLNSGTRSEGATALFYLLFGSCPAFALSSALAVAIATVRAHRAGRAGEPGVRRRALLGVLPLLLLSLWLCQAALWPPIVGWLAGGN